MLLSHKTDIQLNTTESNIVGHMCYAASKLWNVCNYERRNFKELGMVHYPDWYDQKAQLKPAEPIVAAGLDTEELRAVFSRCENLQRIGRVDRVNHRD